MPACTCAISGVDAYDAVNLLRGEWMTLEIPNYRVIEKIGEGAQTRIYRARCMRTGKDYAVKTVKVQSPEDMNIVEMLRTEHAVGASVDHPALRKIYEFRVVRQRLRVRGALLFMEYVEGTPLSDSVAQLSVDRVLELFGKVADGLNAMHLAGYVHADLKPSNILLRPDGTIKLIDFGQSCRIREAKTRIQGTIDYIAPEQVRRAPLDQRTDVFALGAALHRVLTGKPVPTEMNQNVSIHSPNLLGKRVSELQQPILNKLPTSLARIIADCCASNPTRRLADMPAVRHRLETARTILSRREALGSPEETVEEHYLEDELEPQTTDEAVEALFEESAPASEFDEFDDFDEFIDLPDDQELRR